jgi:hypothetical protein
MNFQTSSDSQTYSFPNPLKVQNYFLIAASLASFVAGFGLLLEVRGAIRQVAMGRIIVGMFLALAVLVLAGRMLFQFFNQLRFLFGVGRPVGLAPQIEPGPHGSANPANSEATEDAVKHVMRNRTLAFAEPGDPLANLLHSLIPNLIFTPLPVRRFAESQFQALILYTALIAGLVVAVVLGGGDVTAGGQAVRQWVALIFFALAAPSLRRPQARGEGGPEARSILQMVLLTMFSFLAPPLLALLGDRVPAAPVQIGLVALFLLLFAGLALHGLFFAAIMRHAMPAPSIEVATIQNVWSFASEPSLIGLEVDRSMKDEWVGAVPNRRYEAIVPQADVSRQTGSFAGSWVEETQPQPLLASPISQTPAFPTGDPAMVLAINGMALLLTLWAGLSSFLLASSLDLPGSEFVGRLLETGFTWILAFSAFAVGRALQLRFDFRSTLFWVEVEGSYSCGEIVQGNRYRSDFQASNRVVQVNSMTIRIWCGEIHSVAFGKDTKRFICSMRGLPAKAEALSRRYADFLSSQSALMSLGSEGDHARVLGAQSLQQQFPDRPATLPPVLDDGA